MKYTAGQAAKAVGVSTATISRALKEGKISGSKDTGGAWMIDPAELHRVYPPLAVQDLQKGPLQSVAIPNESIVLQGEVETLRAKLAGAEALNAAHADQIADLRSRLDAEGEERRKLTAVLTHVNETPASRPQATQERGRGLLGWLGLGKV